MGVKNDAWIRRMALNKKMIEPFVDHKVREGVVSYGLSSYGYDFRLGNRFLVPCGGTGDPKNPGAAEYREVEKLSEIPPNSHVIGTSLEYFRIPENVITITQGKSTYARIGVMVNITPFEPGWEGQATISIVNVSSMPVRIYPGEGIAQILFFEGDEPPVHKYRGRYQATRDITLPDIQ